MKTLSHLVHCARASLTTKLDQASYPVLQINMLTTLNTRVERKKWHDKICMIIDVQGFIINSEFRPRELAYATMNGKESGVYYFDTGLKQENLEKLDKASVTSATEDMHGLSFYPKEGESPNKADTFMDILISLYEKYKEPSKYIIGFSRLCHYTELFIMLLPLPVINLKLLDCPIHYEINKMFFDDHLVNCDYHTNHGVLPFPYCARRSAEGFRAWLKKVYIDCTRIHDDGDERYYRFSSSDSSDSSDSDY